MVSRVRYVTAFVCCATHSFGVREQFKQQGAKSVNGPSFVWSLYSLFVANQIGLSQSDFVSEFVGKFVAKT
jgi:hypothetical protein